MLSDAVTTDVNKTTEMNDMHVVNDMNDMNDMNDTNETNETNEMSDLSDLSDPAPRAGPGAPARADADADRARAAGTPSRSALLSHLAAAGLGATVLYFLDPDRGRARRHVTRDKLRHAATVTGAGLGTTRRDLANRAAGVAGAARQPLHTTMYHHGWTTNDNPNHYTTSFGFHAWIDGGLFKKTGGIDVKKLSAKIHPAEKISAVSDPDGIFHTAVNFVVENNQLVEPLYKMDRDGKLSNKGDAGAEGRAFLEGQLVKSGQLLGDLWFTAWLTAPEDTFLEHDLQQRAAAAGADNK